MKTKTGEWIATQTVHLPKSVESSDVRIKIAPSLMCVFNPIQYDHLLCCAGPAEAVLRSNNLWKWVQQNCWGKKRKILL